MDSWTAHYYLISRSISYVGSHLIYFSNQEYYASIHFFPFIYEKHPWTISIYEHIDHKKNNNILLSIYVSMNNAPLGSHYNRNSKYRYTNDQDNMTYHLIMQLAARTKRWWWDHQKTKIERNRKKRTRETAFCTWKK